MFKSLRSRLSLSYFMVAVICLLVSSALLSVLIGPLQKREIYLRLLDRAVPTVLWVRELHNRNETPQDVVQRFSEQTGDSQIRMFLVDRDGSVLADSDNEMTNQYVKQFDSHDIAPAQWPVMSQWTSPRHQRMFFIAVPAAALRAIRRPLGQNVWVIVLATRGRNGLLVELFPSLAMAVLVGLAVSVIAAVLMARSITRPLQQVIVAAEEISRGNYDHTLQINSPDEVGRLAESFNNMALQVKAAQQSQRDFVANVSHDLKTPLTSIRGFAQAILDGTVQQSEGYQHAAQIIKDEAERMTRLVESLLALARISADKDRSSWTQVDLAAVVRACVEQVAIVAQQKQVQFQFDLKPIPRVYGNTDRLAQVFTNLLDNAIKHTPAGSSIVVSTAASVARSTRRGQPARTQVSVSVIDSGPGIPPQDVSRVFDRFYQVDKSRAKRLGGAGLGLAIAKEIVEAHQGSIRVENQNGAGACFVVTLPAV